MNKGIKYRFYPTDIQVKYFNGCFEFSRRYWNLVLSKYNEFVEHNKNATTEEDKIPPKDFCLTKGANKANTDVYGVKQMIEYGEERDGTNLSWFRDYHGTISEGVIIALSNAVSKYKHGTGGEPKFKKKWSQQSVTFRNSKGKDSSDPKKAIGWKYGTIKLPGSSFKVDGQKVGLCKCSLHRKFYGKIQRSTVSRNPDGTWYISLSVNVDDPDIKVPEKVEPENTIGIDIGLDTPLVLDYGIKDVDEHWTKDFPDKYKIEVERIRKRITNVQRAMGKCLVTLTREGAASKTLTCEELLNSNENGKNKYNGYHRNYSKNYMKLRLKKAKLESKIARKRNDFIHNLTSQIVSMPDVYLIGLEDLSVQEMMMRDSTQEEHGIKTKKPRGRRHVKAKQWADISAYEIGRQLEYKASQHGKHVQRVEQRFASSQVCSHCGEPFRELKLTTKVWVCEKCGAVHRRDPNAAKNIAMRARGLYNGDIEENNFEIPW